MTILNLFVSGTVALALLTAPAAVQAQGKRKAAANTGTTTGPARLQPLFGGLPAAEATRIFGAERLNAIAASFASRAEASTFFSTKGLEYLSENQPDTAIYRFNLAWLLNPQNATAYRGLAVVASTQPTPDAAIALLNQALALAPADDLVLSDLGTSYTMRFEQTKKKKDLTAGMELLQRATIINPTNAVAWQQLARAYFYQEKYPQAWEAVHKGRTSNMSSLDFELIGELQAKQPDPQGVFK